MMKTIFMVLMGFAYLIICCSIKDDNQRYAGLVMANIWLAVALLSIGG